MFYAENNRMKKIRKYSCQKCGGKVSKPRCGTIVHEKKVNKVVVKEFEFIGLHGWQCENGCKPCKVKVTLQEYNVNAR